MKATQQVFLTASSLLLVSYASAQTIVTYDSAVTAAIGQSGAADPTSQGWTYTGAGSGYSDGYDSGDGGYRTVDGTSSTVSWYENDIAALDVTTLTSAPGWTLDWTASIDSSALLEGGGGVTNYYLPPNQSLLRQVAGRCNGIQTGHWVSVPVSGSRSLRFLRRTHERVPQRRGAASVLTYPKR